MLGGCLVLRQKKSGVDSKYSCHSILENFAVITKQEKKLMGVTNGSNKEINNAKFSEKRTFLIP